MNTNSNQVNIDFKNDRDATFKLIDWFDIDLVRSSKVLVAGAGATGNESSKNLALLGIGNLFIFDRDTIEMPNLSRSILFRSSDNGQSKAVTAALAIGEINPSIKAKAIIGDLQFDMGLGLIRRMDVVIGCLDNRVARYHLNRFCQMVGRPWIDAGIGAMNGQVQVFVPGQGPCYECRFSESAYEEVSESCGVRDRRYEEEQKIPTTPMIASLVAAVQVQEALKLLDPAEWEGRTLAGREFKFIGTLAEAGVMALPRRPDCPAHFQIDPALIMEMPEVRAGSTTAAQLLKSACELVGEGSAIELNFELAVELKCSKCLSSEKLLKPRMKLLREELVCPGCGQEGHLITTHTIGKYTDEYKEDFLDCTLSELGVPRLDILHVLGAGGKELYLELTGDAEEYFNVE